MVRNEQIFTHYLIMILNIIYKLIYIVYRFLLLKQFDEKLSHMKILNFFLCITLDFELKIYDWMVGYERISITYLNNYILISNIKSSLIYVVYIEVFFINKAIRWNIVWENFYFF